MKKIIQWVLFIIIFSLISFLMLFYLDLANGPFTLFIIEIIVIVLLIVIRFLLSNKNFLKRNSIFLIFILVNTLIVFMAKPAIGLLSVTDSNQKTDILELKDGKIEGLLNSEKSVQVYGSIPYATPPLGELRWKEPQDVKPWEGVLDCTKFAPRSMQEDNPEFMNSLVDMYSEKGWHPNYSSGFKTKVSEDSLYVNLWRPNNNKTNLPILVYIHGGSLTTGSSYDDDINGEYFAKNDIIVVTVAYRLGVFGYLALDELINESTNHTTGNYGLLDQIKALKWVNDNASYFGGNKDNITIAGESAGSSSVNALCVSPLAKGLFKRAIAESSSISQKTPPHTFRTMDNALKTGNELLKEFNCTNVSDLRKIPADKLVKTKTTNSAMSVDGYALRKTPYETYIAHENNEEALLNGYNVKEADPFVIPNFLFNPTNKNNIEERLTNYFNATTAKKFIDLYKEEINSNAEETFNLIISLYWFINPHHTWSNLAYNNGETVYKYQFTKDNGYHGTYHSGEIIYAYGNLYRSKKQFAYNESDYELQNKMSSYWMNYIKTGNPNGNNLPIWEEYSPLKENVLELGQNISMFKDKYLEAYKIIDEFQNN
ncbi:MAG: carboxylesterase family protein [Acholeplasmatales bacterium]|nr:carboxylesterase family protein [Acholeplasmatales bacterium]